MSTSSLASEFLSPPLEALQLRTRKSRSSADGKTDYFPSRDQEAVPPRENSPPESPFPASVLFASIISSANSESESNHSYESKYLTPPQNPEDIEKPPYKARSESSASLNMSASLINDPKSSVQECTAKHRDSKYNLETLVEDERDHRQTPIEQKCPLQQSTRGCQRTCSIKTKSDHDSETLGSLTTGIGAPKCKTGVQGEFIKDYSALSMSTAAPNITSRRWSSLGIEVNEIPRSKTAVNGNTEHRTSHTKRQRRKSLANFHDNEEIMRVVRARLTLHEVPKTRLPTPAIITLRRASGNPIGSNKVPSVRADNDLKLREKQASSKTYLITTSDINFVTNLIKSGFDVRRAETEIPNRNNIVAHKPSVTARGVIPTPSSTADLAITTGGIHQTSRVARDQFKYSQKFMLNAAADDVSGQSQILSDRKTPEVIWEDTQLPVCLYASYRTSSSSGGQAKVIEGSGGESSSSKSASSIARAHSPPTDTLGSLAPKSRDHGNKSPTSRVFQWVFKEPSEEALEPLNLDTGDPSPVEESISPKEPSKKSSSSSKATIRPNVISFPPLLPRQLTSDWFSPLPNISEPSSGNDKCLYDVGIDAQLGSGVKNLNESVIHAKGQSMSLGEIEPPRNSPSPDLECYPRRKSLTIFHPHVSPRLGDSLKVGNALGCSSGARRKSSTKAVRLRIMDEGLEHRSQEMKGLWIKPRKDSGWPVPRSPSPNELNDGKASHALVPPLGQTLSQPSRHPTKFGQLQPDFGMSSSSLLAEVDHSGIYGALTGAKSTTTGCDPECQGEPSRGKMSLGVRNPSTDWIG